MRISRKKQYAVLTGDVVASSKLSAVRRRRLHKAMTGASRAARQALPMAIPADAGIVGGDGWQMLVTVPALSLRAALFYRAFLRAAMESHKLDTRMLIAVGTVDFVPGDRVAEGDGEAYRLSGRGLEAMGRAENACLIFPGSPHESTLDVVVKLVDIIAGRWSDKQALAVTGALQGWTQEKIAKTLWRKPISQQAVAQHLARAGWNGVGHALEYFEALLNGHKQPKKVVLGNNKSKSL